MVVQPFPHELCLLLLSSALDIFLALITISTGAALLLKEDFHRMMIVIFFPWVELCGFFLAMHEG